MAFLKDLLVTGAARFANSVTVNGDITTLGYINGFKIVETSQSNYNTITKDAKTIYLITS
jgi:hypothetical protein